MFYISAPFGNYINAGKKNVLSVIGTYTIDPRPGRLTQILKTLRYSFKSQSWYNSLGLRNPGIKSLKFPLKSNQILSISAIEPNDWRRLHESIPQNIPLELNISCPNIEKDYYNIDAKELTNLILNNFKSLSINSIKYLTANSLK